MSVVYCLCPLSDTSAPPSINHSSGPPTLDDDEPIQRTWECFRVTSFGSLQFGISLAFKCKAWPGNSFPPPPSHCFHCRSVATLLRIASPNPCQEAACGDGARTKLNKQLRNIYTDTRNAMNSSGIKIESKDKKYTSPCGGRGADTGVGSTHFFLVFGRAGWLTFTPCGTLAVHASQSQKQSRPKELSQNSGNNNKQQIAPNL